MAISKEEFIALGKKENLSEQEQELFTEYVELNNIDDIEKYNAIEEEVKEESESKHSPTLEKIDQKIDNLEKIVKERNELGQTGKDAITPPQEGEVQRHGNGYGRVIIGGMLVVGGVFALTQINKNRTQTDQNTTTMGQMGQGVDNGNG